MRTEIRQVLDELLYRIRRPRRVLFDHLPKCAGTTVINYILSHYPERDAFLVNGWSPDQSIAEFKSLSEDARYRYRLVMGHCANELLDSVHPDTITLTIFREPVDRVVSHYFHVRRQEKHYLHEEVMRTNMGLEEYVRSGLSEELRNWYTTYFTGLAPEEAEKNPEQAVQLAARNILARYRIIGLQEDLPSVVHKLKQTARLHRPFRNPVLNRTGGRLALQDVPDQTKRTIAEVNALDVKLYALIKAHAGQGQAG